MLTQFSREREEERKTEPVVLKDLLSSERNSIFTLVGLSPSPSPGGCPLCFQAETFPQPGLQVGNMISQ